MAQFTTRFNIGDKAFTLDKKTNKAIEITIGYAMITTTKDEVKVKYSSMNEAGTVDYLTDFEEAMCFKSKEQLIDYICN